MKFFFAHMASFVFSPLFLAILVPFLVIYKTSGSGFYAMKWFLFSFLFIGCGVFYVFYGRLRGYFSDFDISHKEERPKFYAVILFIAFIFLAISLFLKGYTFPSSIAGFGIVIGIGIFAFINKYIKASGHVGVGCAFVITLGLLYGTAVFLGTLWIVPFLCWSRVVLKRHTILEVIFGGILGSLITLLTFAIGKALYVR